MGKISIVDQVIDQLLTYIEDNKLGPGAKMPTEKETCEMMGVGRSTVREAYKAMQTRDILHSVQGKGVFINDTLHLDAVGENPFGDKKKEFHDYMEIRTAVETTSVRLAIERATPKQIAQLEEIHAEFVEGIDSKNVWKMAETDEKFHSVIADITGNPLLIQVQAVVSRYFKSFRLSSFRNAKTRSHAIGRPHTMIIQAFKDKNPDLGALIMTQHLSQSYVDLSAGLDEKEKKPLL